MRYFIWFRPLNKCRSISPYEQIQNVSPASHRYGFGTAFQFAIDDSRRVECTLMYGSNRKTNTMSMSKCTSGRPMSSTCNVCAGPFRLRIIYLENDCCPLGRENIESVILLKYIIPCTLFGFSSYASYSIHSVGCSASLVDRTLCSVVHRSRCRTPISADNRLAT